MPFTKYEDDYALLLNCQPSYLDVTDEHFISKYIVPADTNLSKSALKKIMKDNFTALFQYHNKPPKWIQSAEWPIENEKPLYFLGQFEIQNCPIFHDDGAAYLFANVDTGEIETVTQFY